MSNKIQNNLLNELPLAAALEPEVKAWADQGWGQGTTQTTQNLLSYWFNRDLETDEKFHFCQRRAIETIIYCHEVLGIETLKQAFEKFAPEALAASAALTDEVQNLPFAKYCLKMATGTGKTWVLAALLVWQYFNALNGERPGKYSTHFLLVAPGHEVLNRLLDMFLGKHDSKTGNRDKSKSDLERPLFMPEGERFRNRFHLQVLEPADIRPNFTPPDEPFVYITNWQQFRLNESSNLWDQLTGADVEEQPRGEIIADFLSEYSDLIIFNDEAHHVHGAKTAKGEELIWRKFLTALYNRMTEKPASAEASAGRRGNEKGVFLQMDFSATPFYGSAEKKEYFPHIVYDFDLVEAMRAMLVKQIFLEERQAMTGEKMEDLDVRAERAEADSEHRRGQVIGVSVSQKLLLDIGSKKMEQIAVEFREKGLDKKPVLFVLAENTGAADLVAEHVANLTDERGRNYRNQILIIHSDKKGEMSDKDWEKYRQQLETLDEPEEINPIRVVVSVLMLREGFDTQNVAVVVVLRSAKADLLLEQIVGRGVRLMFPEYKYPELADLKREAREDVMRKRAPKNSLDFLFVVEHPKFRSFYEELQRQGYAIGIGDSSGTETTGDLVLSEATPERIKNYDLSWPIQVYEQSPKFDFSAIDIAGLPKYSIPFETLKKQLSQIAITETHAETGGKIKTWKLDNQYFDYAHFLRQATMAVASEKGAHILTSKKADITGIIDEYVSNYLFGGLPAEASAQAGEIDFQKAENYTVLNYAPLFDFVVRSIKRVLLDGLGAIQYEVKAGKIGKLSDVKKIYVRESLSVPVERCIYPLSAYSRRGEGFEKKFMEETLDKSAEVEAFGKIQQRKHPFNISYRDKDGIKRDYFPDFIIKTKDKMYIVETKAEDEMQKAEGNEKNLIVLKARAAMSWCKTASQVSLPNQPQEWEYFMLSEKTFNENRQLGFDSLAGLGKLDLERLLVAGEGKLF